MRGISILGLSAHTFAFLCGAAFQLNATTFLIKTDEEKILEAESICAVQVIEVPSQPPASFVAKNIPITFAKVKPIECFKGGSSENFLVSWPGGNGEVTINGKRTPSRTIVPGATNLRLNQTAVLFLVKGSPTDSYFQVYGMINGVTNLQWDDKTKQYILKSRSLRTNTSPGHQSTFSDVETLKGFGAKVRQVLGQSPTK